MNQTQVQKSIDRLKSILDELKLLPSEINENVRNKYFGLLQRIINIHDLVFENKETKTKAGILKFCADGDHKLNSNYQSKKTNLIQRTQELLDTIEILLLERNLSSEIFIVHGHNENQKNEVARLLERHGLKIIILHEQLNNGNTIIEKFIEFSNVKHAIVLLSSDDTCKDKYRARQNVIFEFGYFIGKLGRQNVIALIEKKKNFEMPSDLSGLLYIDQSNNNWKYNLLKELSKSYNIKLTES